MRSWIFARAACSLLVAMVPGPAAAKDGLNAFVAAQGCAIGPPTYVAALEAGYGREAIDALAATADNTAGTLRTGDWIVLPASLCRIAPPAVRSEIRIGDREVAALTSAIDAYADTGDRGCFLDGPGLMERVQATRGWDAERANREYMRFLAENLRSGDLAFYGSDPLSTPPGFQILTGACADVPAIDAIRRAQALRDRTFDAVIRADAAHAVCGRDSSPSYLFGAIMQEQTKGENTNAWAMLDVTVMTIGGGWYIGNGATEKGTPRPPLCRFE